MDLAIVRQEVERESEEKRRKLLPAVVSLRNFSLVVCFEKDSEGGRCGASHELVYIGLRIAGRVSIFPFFI